MASRLHEILRWDVFSDIETGPRTRFSRMISRVSNRWNRVVKCKYRFNISWHCWDACQISERLVNYKHLNAAFKSLLRQHRARYSCRHEPTVCTVRGKQNLFVWMIDLWNIEYWIDKAFSGIYHQNKQLKNATDVFRWHFVMLIVVNVSDNLFVYSHYPHERYNALTLNNPLLKFQFPTVLGWPCTEIIWYFIITFVRRLVYHEKVCS